MSGKVFLVGVGPGNPKLLTLQAYELLQKGDVILYDRLVSQEILSLIPKHLEMIYVGKRKGLHHFSQDEINQLMLKLVKKGMNVIRLKGGDPFIFGRGSEEIQFLERCNIPYTIVPGLSSLTAIPTSVGIPLTHRTLSSSFLVLTGTEDPSKDEKQIDWKQIANLVPTIVILMGVTNLPTIVAQLLDGGKDPDTPVAIIEWGTTPKQKIIIGSLTLINEITEQANIQPPSLIIIGEVVSFLKKKNKNTMEAQ
ncbi:MAG: uroporphyrinogen-III C-methyltransferase [Candidatus Helarchaeota archaeon]